jgi:hypothetical protein
MPRVRVVALRVPDDLDGIARSRRGSDGFAQSRTSRGATGYAQRTLNERHVAKFTEIM